MGGLGQPTQELKITGYHKMTIRRAGCGTHRSEFNAVIGDE